LEEEKKKLPQTFEKIKRFLKTLFLIYKLVLAVLFFFFFSLCFARRLSSPRIRESLLDAYTHREQTAQYFGWLP
jgi:hypothetical protein